MAFKNDMTMMYRMLAALRRELERIARVTACSRDDPKQILRTTAGWPVRPEPLSSARAPGFA